LDNADDLSLLQVCGDDFGDNQHKADVLVGSEAADVLVGSKVADVLVGLEVTTTKRTCKLFDDVTSDAQEVNPWGNPEKLEWANSAKGIAKRADCKPSTLTVQDESDKYWASGVEAGEGGLAPKLACFKRDFFHDGWEYEVSAESFPYQYDRILSFISFLCLVACFYVVCSWESAQKARAHQTGKEGGKIIMKSKNMIQWLTWTAQVMIIHLTLPIQVPTTNADVDVKGSLMSQTQATADGAIAQVGAH